jgi:hypothetical protein
MEKNINIQHILEEIEQLKRQMAEAQSRLGRLEALLRKASEQAQPEAQPTQPSQPTPPQPTQPSQPTPPQPQPAAQPAQEPVEFEFNADPELALRVMEMIASRGGLRVSTIRWYLSFERDIRVSEAEVVHVVKSLEGLGALKGTWSAPGIRSRSAPVLDPKVDRGPEFSVVRRRLEELTRKRR